MIYQLLDCSGGHPEKYRRWWVVEGPSAKRRQSLPPSGTLVYIMVVLFRTHALLATSLYSHRLPSSNPALLVTDAQIIVYQDHLLRQADMAVRSALHTLRVVLTFGLLLVLIGSTLHLSSMGAPGRDAYLAKRSGISNDSAANVNSTLPPLSLYKRVSAYSTTPKASEDQLALAFWKGDW